MRKNLQWILHWGGQTNNWVGLKSILPVACKINLGNKGKPFVQREQNATIPFIRSRSKQKRERPFFRFLPWDLWKTFGWKLQRMFSNSENQAESAGEHE